jgi:hypothetical protein
MSQPFNQLASARTRATHGAEPRGGSARHVGRVRGAHSNADPTRTPIPFGRVSKLVNQNGFSDHVPITMTVIAVEYSDGASGWCAAEPAVLS